MKRIFIFQVIVISLIAIGFYGQAYSEEIKK